MLTVFRSSLEFSTNKYQCKAYTSKIFDLKIDNSFYGPCEGVPDGQHGSHCDFSPFTTVGTVLGSEVVIAVCFIFNSQNAIAFATQFIQTYRELTPFRAYGLSMIQPGADRGNKTCRFTVLRYGFSVSVGPMPAFQRNRASYVKLLFLGSQTRSDTSQVKTYSEIIVAPLCNGSQHTSATLPGRYALREDEARSDKNIGIFIYPAHTQKNPTSLHPSSPAARTAETCGVRTTRYSAAHDAETPRADGQSSGIKVGHGRRRELGHLLATDEEGMKHAEEDEQDTHHRGLGYPKTKKMYLAHGGGSSLRARRDSEQRFSPSCSLNGRRWGPLSAKKWTDEEAARLAECPAVESARGSQEVILLSFWRKMLYEGRPVVLIESTRVRGVTNGEATRLEVAVGSAGPGGAAVDMVLDVVWGSDCALVPGSREYAEASGRRKGDSTGFASTTPSKQRSTRETWGPTRKRVTFVEAAGWVRKPCMESGRTTRMAKLEQANARGSRGRGRWQRATGNGRDEARLKAGKNGVHGGFPFFQPSCWRRPSPISSPMQGAMAQLTSRVHLMTPSARVTDRENAASQNEKKIAGGGGGPEEEALYAAHPGNVRHINAKCDFVFALPAPTRMVAVTAQNPNSVRKRARGASNALSGAMRGSVADTRLELGVDDASAKKGTPKTRRRLQNKAQIACRFEAIQAAPETLDER
ncbi:hypothetical protein B0H13DRAFT_2280801 [Mycena leptocephala]|nr:hypothetical protein B0H13DRAFT_2280801 [Mycena leptocephala]